MANTSAFNRGSAVNVAHNTLNSAGGLAFAMDAKEELAQMATTGTFRNTFYDEKEIKEVDRLCELCNSCGVEFVSQLALYARQKCAMKDMPAALLVWIYCTETDTNYFEQIFNDICDTGRMLRNFVQILRSGVFGKRSLGSRAKRAVQQWLLNRPFKRLVTSDNIGSNPSIGDIVKLSHVKPISEEQEAVFAYLRGHEIDFEHNSNPNNRDADNHFIPVTLFRNMPRELQELVAFIKLGDYVTELNENGLIKKAAEVTKQFAEMPIPEWGAFRLIDRLPLQKSHWEAMCKNMSWFQLTQYLGTLHRQGALADPGWVIDKLTNKELIEKSNTLPHQLFAGVVTLEKTAGFPAPVLKALKFALDYSLKNMPKFNGSLLIAVDNSGSMGWPVTGMGSAGQHTTSVTCSDVAGMLGAALAANVRKAKVVTFDTSIVKTINTGFGSKTPIKHISDVASKINGRGGGTDCGCVLRGAAKEYDAVIIISDNESWASPWGSTLAEKWRAYKAKNSKCKLVCLDLASNNTVQAETNEAAGITNLGGWSSSTVERILSAIGANDKRFDDEASSDKLKETESTLELINSIMSWNK